MIDFAPPRLSTARRTRVDVRSRPTVTRPSTAAPSVSRRTAETTRTAARPITASGRFAETDVGGAVPVVRGKSPPQTPPRANDGRSRRSSPNFRTRPGRRARISSSGAARRRTSRPRRSDARRRARRRRRGTGKKTAAGAEARNSAARVAAERASAAAAAARAWSPARARGREGEGGRRRRRKRRRRLKISRRRLRIRVSARSPSSSSTMAPASSFGSTIRGASSTAPPEEIARAVARVAADVARNLQATNVEGDEDKNEGARDDAEDERR